MRWTNTSGKCASDPPPSCVVSIEASFLSNVWSAVTRRCQRGTLSLDSRLFIRREVDFHTLTQTSRWLAASMKRHQEGGGPTPLSWGQSSQIGFPSAPPSGSNLSAGWSRRKKPKNNNVSANEVLAACPWPRLHGPIFNQEADHSNDRVWLEWAALAEVRVECHQLCARTVAKCIDTIGLSLTLFDP